MSAGPAFDWRLSCSADKKLCISPTARKIMFRSMFLECTFLSLQAQFETRTLFVNDQLCCYIYRGQVRVNRMNIGQMS